MIRCLPLLLLVACATQPAPSVPVSLTLANAGAEPLRCLVIYGHWVTGDLPVIAPGGSAAVTVQREPASRAVFVPRDPDGRRMMLEEILCGANADWQASRTHIDIEAVKLGEGASYALSCEGGDTIVCTPWQAR